MWRKHEQTTMIGLIMLMAIVLGFWGGYRLLPRSGLAHSAVFTGGLLYGALPYAVALADEPPAAEPAPQLLLQASLPAGSVLVNLPDYYAAEAPIPAAEEAETNLTAAEPPGPEKAEPRLIMIAEDSVAAFAALNLAEQAEETVPAEGAPRIMVYCTHSSEEYKNQSRIPGAHGGVHTVAERLSNSLNARGLPTIYCDTVHDYPDWDLSYGSSLASIQKLQQQYPSLEVFIDVHRDSLANSVLSTGKGQVARIMLVVGSNARLEHPNWQRNKAFAEQIQQKLEARTSGITRSVNVQNGRYNQQVSTKAILVEMGSTANTVEEACASADLLADALAALL